jgi:hypothetical protein
MQCNSYWEMVVVCNIVFQYYIVYQHSTEIIRVVLQIPLLLLYFLVFFVFFCTFLYSLCSFVSTCVLVFFCISLFPIYLVVLFVSPYTPSYDPSKMIHLANNKRIVKIGQGYMVQPLMTSSALNVSICTLQVQLNNPSLIDAHIIQTEQNIIYKFKTYPLPDLSLILNFTSINEFSLDVIGYLYY